MIIDIHVHAFGEETAKAVLDGMDAAGIDKCCLFAPAPETDELSKRWAMREATDWLARIAAEAPDRILPFCWIEPTLPGAVQELEYAIADKGFAGVKMIANHWYPCDETVFPVYEKAGELNAPIIFHSGILYFHGDSSRFNRPVFWEPLLHFPKVRFALAHISWPWVDECLALYGRFRALNSEGREHPHQMWIDTTPGTPPAWREDALRKTLSFAGDEYILWGSDSVGTGIHEHGVDVLRSDRQLLHQQLGAPAETERRWLGENALRFLGLV
ncbi:MAG: amidohydrolase [Chloroflexi bacterium]|nr:amidohydrolase [Chloroflexota bacterium]